MCGIAGWFDVHGRSSPDQGLIKAMADSIRHRGPDGDGFHFEPGLALAHRRLAIIDLDTGQQPMETENGRVVVVFNGEIYNYRSIREGLIGRGHRFTTQSDTEVLLRAWMEWGPGCVDHLQGMFAFALWDRQSQSLFLARDRLGEKPLYYCILRDESLLFASELKALLVDPRVQRKIDPCAVEEYFSFGYIADPRTIYCDVRKLEAGHSLTFTRGSAPRLRQFWDATPLVHEDRGLACAADELRQQLQSSVVAQLVADVPVGTFLSGGVDSSAVTALAASRVPDSLNSFTIGFSDPKFDERQHAREVALRYHVRQFTSEASGNETDLVEELPKIFDEPFGDSSALPTLLLAKLASTTVKVALSGDGGDELFAGYRRYFFHNREESLRGVMPAQARKVIFGNLAKIYPQLDWLPRPLRARQTFRELSCSSAEGYFHNVSVLDDDTREKLFSPSFARELSGYRASEVISKHMAKAPTDDPVTAAQYVDIKTWLVSDILTKVDRTSMSCGLEVRVPMLDEHLVRWSLGLPLSMKLSRRDGKIVLKRALEPLLPQNILYRKKQGFSVPLASWFRGSLGRELAISLTNSSLCSEYLDTGFAQHLLSCHQKGWRDYSRALWLIWMFMGFLETTHVRGGYRLTPPSVHDSLTQSV